MRARTRVTLAGVAVAAALLAGCGDDDARNRSDGPDPAAGATAGATTETSAPPATDPSATTRSSGVALPGVPSAEQAACTLTRGTIETALEAQKVMSGRYPQRLDELLGGVLDPAADLSEWRYSSDGSTYSLDGPC